METYMDKTVETPLIVVSFPGKCGENLIAMRAHIKSTLAGTPLEHAPIIILQDGGQVVALATRTTKAP